MGWTIEPVIITKYMHITLDTTLKNFCKFIFFCKLIFVSKFIFHWLIGNVNGTYVRGKYYLFSNLVSLKMTSPLFWQKSYQNICNLISYINLWPSTTKWGEYLNWEKYLIAINTIYTFWCTNDYTLRYSSTKLQNVEHRHM